MEIKIKVLSDLEFFYMVKLIRDVEKALGDGIKKIEKSEKQTRIIQRRSIFSIKDIAKGEIITKSNVQCLRPAIGLSASSLKIILGKKTKRKILSFSVIKADDIKF